MLIENPITANDIVCIKLSNGDELIAKFIEKNDQYVTVNKPMLMILAQNPNTGHPGVQLAPFWMLGADDDAKFKLNLNHVVCTIKAKKDAANGYISQTSGLTIPKGAGLLTA